MIYLNNNTDIQRVFFPRNNNVGYVRQTGAYTPGRNIDISDDRVISVTGITSYSGITSQDVTTALGYTPLSQQDISTKQDVLVSGTNIKTINNQSILGSGNIEIQAGSGTTYTAGANIDITNDIISVTGITSYSGITSQDVEDALGYVPASASDMDNKQDLLVSGQNIKTINNQNILGSGNIEIQGGTGTTNPNAYATIRKIEDYAYEVDYVGIDYEYAKQYFQQDFPYNVGACSVIAVDNLVGRNYDWYYGNQASFVVHTPNVVGVAGVAALTKAVVESSEYNEAYKILPFFLTDGFNKDGLFCEMNVVPATGEEKTIPALEKRDSIPTVMLVRYILDNFTSVDAAVDYLHKYVEIFNPTPLSDMGYEIHYLLKDNTKTVVLEIVDNDIVVVNKNISTNFHLNGVTFNQDGTVYTPETAIDGHYATSQGIEEYGTGLERWNILNSKNITTKASMRTAMSDVIYSKAYTNRSNIWHSEFVGYSDQYGVDITVDTPANNPDFVTRIQKYQQKWETKDRNTPEVWHTVHSCVYDLQHKEIDIIFQESGNEHPFGLVYGYVAGDNIEIENNTISAVVPTKTSDLINDSGYLTQHQDISGKVDRTEIADMATETWVEEQGYLTQQDISGKQDKLVSGTNIKTVNNLSLLGSGNITIQGGSGTTYTAGTNIDITNDIISVTGITSYTGITSSDVTTALGYTPLSQHQDISGKVDRSEIADMATETWVEEQGYLTHQDISGKLDSSLIWSGTQAQWDNLTPAQQSSYLIALVY